MMKYVLWLPLSLAVVLTLTPSSAAGQTGVVLTGAPTGTTNETNPEIHVSAPNAVSYKYSLNGAPYSDELLIQTPINFNAGVHIGSRTFAAGSKELYDFINLRTTNQYTPFLDSITLSNVESQLQITYLVNKMRTSVEPENVLNIRGTDVGNLDVALQEKIPAGTRYELSSLSVTGGELSKQASADSTTRFILSLALNSDAVILTPKANNSQTIITVNGQPSVSGSSIVLSHPVDGSSISLQAAGLDGSQVSYSIDVRYDDSLDQTIYRSYYLRAFNPSSAYVSIHNNGASVVAHGITFNKKFGLTTQGIISEINAMAPEFTNESTPRKVWRFIRDNRYHFERLTDAHWYDSPALFLNSAGFGYCGDSASVFYFLVTGMGYSARVWELSGHIVPEVFVNNRWEMWDPDLEVYYENREGSIAGVEELAADPDLITNPTNPILHPNDLSRPASPYGQYVADIYSSTGDNAISHGPQSLVDPTSIIDSPMILEIPPGATLEFPDVYESPLDATLLTNVPSYANARLVIPAGFSGTVPMPLFVHSIGWSNNPKLSLVTKNGTGNWDSLPVTTNWTVDFVPPVTKASQPAGYYNLDQVVTLATNEPATIYYTTDGSTPTEASSVYTPLTAIPGGVVKFFAIDPTGNREEVRAYGPAVHLVELQITGTTSTTTTFSASASGGTGSYEYIYWMRDPLLGWSIVQPWGSANAWTWDEADAAPGIYNIQVWARNAGTTVTYDVWAALTYVVFPAQPTSVTLNSNVLSPQVAGAQVTFNAAAIGTSGNYQYLFYLRNSQGAWSLVQPYGSSSNWTWNTASGQPGTYGIQVWARNTGTTVSYDVWKEVSFTVVAGPASSVTLSSSVLSPQGPGTQVTFNAAAIGTSGNYQYLFYLRNPQGIWSLVQPYGSSNWTADLQR